MVLGLGNPGRKYHGTRHNLGYGATSELAARHGINLTRKSLLSLWGAGLVEGERVIIAQPQTFMNRSGRAAKALSDYFKLTPEDILVVADDLDLPMGRIRVASKGGDAGHRGMRDIIKALGTSDFPRLKMGIGRPRYGEPVESYVLSGFYATERTSADKLIFMAADCLEVILTQGIQSAMQKFHSASMEKEEEG